MFSRRNTLAFLGLASASSAALATDAMLEPGVDTKGWQLHPLHWNNGKRCAQALRRLADGFESGEVNFTSLNLSSDINYESWLSQVLTVRFELKTDAES